MRIALLEPFLGGSHQQWAEGLQRHSQHEIRIFGLPDRHWKWRMHGGAVSLARQYLAADFKADLFLATDMLDLTTFLSLTRRAAPQVPALLYFHENQLAYPWSPGDPDPGLNRDHHYSFINYTSALAADALLFNSAYNQASFLNGLPAYLRMYPDAQELGTVPELVAKSRVMPLGLDLCALDTHRVPRDPALPPLVLWNHRWEHDKGPEAFFAALIALDAAGVDFRLAVLGEQFKQVPAAFAQARGALAHRIVHWGYAATQADYARWLWQADVLPVTGRQDFFGGSVVEAMYCGVRPVLPNRLAYPSHVPAAFHPEVLYTDEADLVTRLQALLMTRPFPALPTQAWVSAYDWTRLIQRYDALFSEWGRPTGPV
jgi:glycosyltransferase involved in cell wall biosynthesis